MVFTAGVALAKDYTVQKKADDYTVDITMDKNPPVVGANNMEVVVTDQAGKPVTNAKVQVVASMPAVPGRPAVENKADAKLDKGKFKTQVNLAMGGSWNISVRITQGIKTTTVKYTVDNR